MEGSQNDSNGDPLIEGKFYDIYTVSVTEDDDSPNAEPFLDNVLYQGINSENKLGFKTRMGYIYHISPSKTFRRFTGPKKYVYRLAPLQKYIIYSEDTDTEDNEDMMGGKKKRVRNKKTKKTRRFRKKGRKSRKNK